MTSHRRLFTSCKRLISSGQTIHTADGNTTPAVAKGDIAIPLLDTSQKVKNVFHVPGLMVNLLSIPELAKSGVATTFGPREATLSRKGKTVARAALVGNRYILESGSPEMALACTKPTAPFDLWHRRLGHLGRNKVAGFTRSTRGLEHEIAIPKHLAPCDTCLRT